MQKLFLWCCCFWLCNLSAQNNWNPFPQQIAYFNKGTANPMDMYWADSTTTTPLGQMMHIVGQKYYHNVVGNCGDTIYAQMRYYNLNIATAIPKPDSFVFDNDLIYYKRGDGIDSFPYLANAGDSWTQQIMQPFADSIVWNCDSIVWANHLGFDDSIKYFSAQPMQNGLNLALQQVKLAKNLGFISFIPFSYNWDSLTVPIWENIGFIHHTAGHFGFTSSQLNWERKVCSTDDVFTYFYYERNRNFRAHIVDSITYFYETNDSLIYHVQSDKYTAAMGNFYLQTNFDTITIDKHFPQSFYQNPNKSLSYGRLVNNGGNDWIYINYMEYNENAGLRELYYDNCLNAQYYDSSACVVQQSLSDSDILKVRCKENLGCVWSEIGNMSSPSNGSAGWLCTLNLIGYRTCGDTMGNTNRDSLANMAMRWTGIEKISLPSAFRLYPNPSQNIIQIEINPLFISYSQTIEIYNLAGNLLKIKELNSGNLHSLDISELPQGLYTLRLRNEKIIEQNLFLKQ